LAHPAGLVLTAVTEVRTRAWPWVLLGVVAIDIDHIPLYLWGGPLAAGGGRPVTHSLATVVALLAAGLAVPRLRRGASWLAVGVLLHFVRDVATSPGVPLWLPVKSDSVLLPYRAYLILLVALAAIAVVKELIPRRVPGADGTLSARA
jgi:inner membrane protein